MVALGDARQKFWTDFLERLKPMLNDREQPIRKPSRQGYLSFTLPAPGGTSWLTVYRDMKANEVGLFFSSHRNTAGEDAMLAIADDWDGPLLGGTASRTERNGRPRIGDVCRLGSLEDPEIRDHAFSWLAERTNTFINVLRPRVRSAVADQRDE